MSSSLSNANDLEIVTWAARTTTQNHTHLSVPHTPCR